MLPDVEIPAAGAGEVTGAQLGMTVLAKTGYENPDGSAVVFDTDYFGQERSENSVLPGPFVEWSRESGRCKIW